MSEIIDEAKRLLAALDEDTSRTAQLRVLSHALAEARSKPRDWPAFWASLTDAEAEACLAAAPRVAGEWDEITPRKHARWGHGEGCYVGLVVKKCGVWRVLRPLLADQPDDGYPTADLARSACDAALRAAGWRVP